MPLVLVLSRWMREKNEKAAYDGHLWEFPRDPSMFLSGNFPGVLEWVFFLGIHYKLPSKDISRSSINQDILEILCEFSIKFFLRPFLELFLAIPQGISSVDSSRSSKPMGVFSRSSLRGFLQNLPLRIPPGVPFGDSSRGSLWTPGRFPSENLCMNPIAEDLSRGFTRSMTRSYLWRFL